MGGSRPRRCDRRGRGIFRCVSSLTRPAFRGRRRGALPDVPCRHADLCRSCKARPQHPCIFIRVCVRSASARSVVYLRLSSLLCVCHSCGHCLSLSVRCRDTCESDGWRTDPVAPTHCSAGNDPSRSQGPCAGSDRSDSVVRCPDDVWRDASRRDPSCLTTCTLVYTVGAVAAGHVVHSPVPSRWTTIELASGPPK